MNFKNGTTIKHIRWRDVAFHIIAVNGDYVKGLWYNLNFQKLSGKSGLMHQLYEFAPKGVDTDWEIIDPYDKKYY